MNRIKLTEEMESLIVAIETRQNLAMTRFGGREFAFASMALKDGEDPRVVRLQQITKKALSEDREMYFKGVPCYSCTKEQVVDSLLSTYRNKDALTLSCMFTNITIRYMKPLLDAIKGRNVIMIAPWRALCVQNPHFPVNVRYVFRYKEESFSQFNLLGEVRKFISKHNLKDFIFMVAETQKPLGSINESNILINELHKFNKDNTYINVGNIFDPVFYGEALLPYQNLKHMDSYKNCVIDIPEEKK